MSTVSNEVAGAITALVESGEEGREQILAQLDLESKGVDLELRQLLGEVNPRPFLIRSRLFYEHFPGKWPQGEQLKNPVDKSVLQRAYRVAGLGKIEAILDGRNRYATNDQAMYTWLANRGQCGYCQKNVHPDYMQVDHIVPFSQGGKTLVENLVCSCKECNIAKNAEDPIDFMRLAYSENGRYLISLLYRYRRDSSSVDPAKIDEVFNVMYGVDLP